MCNPRSRLVYRPRSVADFLAEEQQRIEQDKPIVREFQRRAAERRALHSFTLPWAFTIAGLVVASFCFACKYFHWLGVR